MRIETLLVPTADGRADALAVHPGDGASHPGVLMYPDGFGIRPVLRELAVELAGHGYFVLVPNPFYRHGPTPLLDLPEHIGDDLRPQIFAQVMPLIRAHTPDRARRDAAAYLDHLTSRPEVSAGPVAVTGYCIGGLLAARTAAAHPGRVAAVAGFHSPFGADETERHELLATLTAELHLGHAASDLTPETLADLNRDLDAAGVKYCSEIYPGTVHGYTMADTDSFDAAALQRHWDDLLALLARTLAG
ncbi:dienelactone hydrolase family protein [Nocardia sp. NPDC127579]|uniref:dienelactone hydrolase family protein n=1 Tax=Nocardia sp. NPDC127579 TaxID=3345402 RepID=UPI003638436C